VDVDVLDIHELLAVSLGIVVGGSRGETGDRRLAQARTGAAGRGRSPGGCGSRGGCGGCGSGGGCGGVHP
jgi:hypothetical protein